MGSDTKKARGTPLSNSGGHKRDVMRTVAVLGLLRDDDTMRVTTVVCLFLVCPLAGCDSSSPTNGDGSAVASDPYQLAEDGEVAALDALLKRDRDAAVRPNRAGFQPLHYASLGNQPRIVEVLINAGADPDARNGLGQTPLHVAAMACATEAAIKLLEMGADPAARVSPELPPEVQQLNLPPLGPSVLSVFAHNGEARIVKHLLKLNVPLLEPVNHATDTALHWACCRSPREKRWPKENTGNREVLIPLTRAYGDINVRGAEGKTPLHVAAESGNVETVRVLLKEFPDVDLAAVDDNGETALDLVSRLPAGLNKDSEGRQITDLLLKQGAPQ